MGKKSLFHKLVWIFVLHIVLLVTIVFDMCPYAYKTKALENFFTYDEGVMISSLLVVWTFLTAIIIYYLGRKDERFCGLPNSRIIFDSMGKLKKVILVSLFFMELFLILFSVVIHLPITLVALAVLLPITTFYMLWIVMKSTSDEVLISQLKLMLEQKKNKTVKYDVLESMLLRWNYANGENIEILKEILSDYFQWIAREEVIFPTEKMVMFIEQVMENINDDRLKIDFLKGIAHNVTEEETSKAENSSLEKRDTDILTVLICVLVKNIEKYSISFCREILSVIQKSHIRRRLVLRGIVYNKYLETCAGKRNRMLVQEKLVQLLQECITTKDKENTLLFMSDLCKSVAVNDFYWKDIMDLLPRLEGVS